MSYNKKFGLILMALSVLVAISSLLISDCYPCSMEMSMFQKITMVDLLGIEAGYKLNFFDDSVNIPYKYVLLSCLTFFTAGLLFFLGAINAPFRLVIGKLLGVSSDNKLD